MWYNLHIWKMGDIVRTIGNEKYCLNNKVKVLWVDQTFGLAKVFFIDEGKEKIVGIGLITDQPKEESTLSLSILTGGIK